MKLVVDGTAVGKAVDDLLRLAAPTSGSIVVQSLNGKLTFTSSSMTSMAKVVVPCKVEGDAQFGIAPGTLKSSCTKSEVSMLLKNEVLTVASGKSTLTLPVQAVTEQSGFEVENPHKTTFTAEQAAELAALVKLVDGKQESATDWIPVGISVSAKGAFIASYTPVRLSWVSSSAIKGDARIVLPIATVAAALSVFGKDKFVLTTGSNAVKFSSPRAVFEAAAPSGEGAIPFDAVLNKAKEYKSAKLTQVSVAKADITDFLVSSRAVTQSSRAELSLQAAKGKVKLKVSTTEGSAEALLKGQVSAPVSAKLDLDALQVCLSKITGDVNIALDDSMALIQEDKATTALGLNE